MQPTCPRAGQTCSRVFDGLAAPRGGIDSSPQVEGILGPAVLVQRAGIDDFLRKSLPGPSSSAVLAWLDSSRTPDSERKVAVRSFGMLLRRTVGEPFNPIVVACVRSNQGLQSSYALRLQPVHDRPPVAPDGGIYNSRRPGLLLPPSGAMQSEHSLQAD